MMVRWRRVRTCAEFGDRATYDVKLQFDHSSLIKAQGQIPFASNRGSLPLVLSGSGVASI